MASLTNLPKKFSAGHQIRPRSAHRINPIKAIQDREWRRKQMAAAAVAGGSEAGSPPPERQPSTQPTQTRTSSRPQCPNKACKNPNVVDGTCRSCGRVSDDSNIVAEVTFGENSMGAAVVQGSFLSHDQGGVRPMAGIGHRRVAGNGSAEARERTLREAKMLMTGYAHQLNIPEHTVTVGFQYYKLASSANFVQGRKIQNVVAVCLYAACRKSTQANPCKIMLIDLADLVKEEVFFLGRTFKKLLQTIDVAARDVQPIYVEDLIFRFAAKLEFDTMTNKVAETAVRLVQRMDRDWMVMGRRPAGICGACLIMAARMYNFRRTVREVVYIAKVTMATLQMRLDEFKELPSAKMTVEEFLAQDFLTEEFDPPSVYKKSEEYQARLREKRRSLKRKRPGDSNGAEASPAPMSTPTPTPEPTKAQLPPSQPILPRVVDADGFAVPAVPPARASALSRTEPDQGLIEQALEAGDEDTVLDEQLDALAEEYGDGSANNEVESVPLTEPRAESLPMDAASDAGSVTTTAKRRRRGPDGSSCRSLPVSSVEPDYVDDEWRADEENLEMEMTEAINSPGCLEHARAFAAAEKRAQMITMSLAKAKAEAAAAAAEAAAAVATETGTTSADDSDPAADVEEGSITPATAAATSSSSGSLDSPEVDEDEFKDDPEVQFCLLSEAEAAAKEKIWMNENRAYLRMRQEREFRAKMAAANGTKKQTRRRLKKPKIGEGQTSPATTPGEAAVEAMERRGFSKRINYDAMRRMLDRPAASLSSRAGSASVFGSFSYSRAGSSAGSVMGDPADEDEDEELDEDDGAAYDEHEVDPFADDGEEEEAIDE
ncbi:transcription factor tfiiib complex subunit [Grosmannia clavigera kw1407]|uniref:Transcription factor tfiiib complex subunit n=1 Tax=Grosmannia clavigera (strain kw1407 / UAMH 11150) TaxID=655863 RepID=F0XJH7_GROCL|nr:transcription factor tfiiib complex subunit [Grosmannia clavigera kw1407]EFX02236.1 transcription factor tfiiib complex subunit [Grosmannia clavigera kw1407]